MGIILEDDTLPEESFFGFCETVLKKYRTDSRIGLVAGSNHMVRETDYSYFFSKNQICAGFATWRRSWTTMDFEMSWRSSPQAPNILKNQGVSRYFEAYWRECFQAVDEGRVDAWDYQWCSSLSAQNQLTVIPKFNLVANLGFGADATHTTGEPGDKWVLTREMEFPLEAPPFVVPDLLWDAQFEKQNRKRGFSLFRFIPAPAKDFIRRVLRRLRKSL